ncbi:MAG: nucleotide exchange factor GrpE [archaeon]|nr:nucleotide exchange factor GrpE [archaeon]
MAGEFEEDRSGTEEKSLVEELQERLEKAENEAAEYLRVAQRLQADFDNFRKRTLRENEEFRTFAVAGIISEILSIVDDFDRALQQVKEKSDFVVGVVGIRQNLMKILESKGLKEISTDGKFDPSCHEALCTIESDNEGSIAEVFQKGYRIGDRILRCSKVKVTTKKQEIKETQVSEDV